MIELQAREDLEKSQNPSCCHKTWSAQLLGHPCNNCPQHQPEPQQFSAGLNIILGSFSPMKL